VTTVVLGIQDTVDVPFTLAVSSNHGVSNRLYLSGQGVIGCQLQ